jgi:hypothetical protein
LGGLKKRIYTSVEAGELNFLCALGKRISDIISHRWWPAAEFTISLQLPLDIGVDVSAGKWVGK